MKTAIVTALYGARFHRLAATWFRWNRRFFPPGAELHLVTIDGLRSPNLVGRAQYWDCAGGDTADAYSKLAAHMRLREAECARLAKTIELCRSGYTVVQMDVDVALFRNITLLLSISQDMVFSRAFGAPRECVNRLGFVACTGFFVAKPSSLHFLTQWLHDIQSSRLGDQKIVNMSWIDRQWRREEFRIGRQSFENAVATMEECTVAVLDKRLITRNGEPTALAIADHSKNVPDTYWNAPWWKLMLKRGMHAIARLGAA